MTPVGWVGECRKRKDDSSSPPTLRPKPKGRKNLIQFSALPLPTASRQARGCVQCIRDRSALCVCVCANKRKQVLYSFSFSLHCITGCFLCEFVCECGVFVFQQRSFSLPKMYLLPSRDRPASPAQVSRGHWLGGNKCIYIYIVWLLPVLCA